MAKLQRMTARIARLQDSPFVFVVGCPRSGTTLLQRMLNSHPRLAVANDTHFIPRVLKKVPITCDPLATPALAEATWSYHRFRRLGISRPDFNRIARTSVRYSDLVCQLYRQLAANQQKELGGEKTPDYCRHIPRLHRLFPRAKFVHLIRDGRDVALSTLEWAHENKGPGRLALWSENPLGVCALWWASFVQAGCRDGSQLPPGLYQEVRYEELVENPRGTLQAVSHFLGLEYSSEMERFYEGKVRQGSRLSAKSAWLPVTKGLRDWRSQMTSGDIELFEALVGRVLTELGYARLFESFTPQTAEMAAELKNLWNLKSTSSGRPAYRKKHSKAPQ